MSFMNMIMRAMNISFVAMQVVQDIWLNGNSRPFVSFGNGMRINSRNKIRIRKESLLLKSLLFSPWAPNGCNRNYFVLAERTHDTRLLIRLNKLLIVHPRQEQKLRSSKIKKKEISTSGDVGGEGHDSRTE